MTDEEMAEEIVKRNVCENCNRCQSHGYIGCDIYRYSKDSFLAGFKAGRPQWHDLRKDPNDLPKEDKYYLIVTKLNNYYISRFRGTCWIGKCNAYVSEDMVIAWCEIPTFDKE